jgi:hypothetical protein
MFVLPAIAIIVIGIYAFVQLNSPGTLIVQAQDASCVQLQENCPQLQVAVTVNGKEYTTPTTISVGQGNYVATFSTIEYYYPPSSRDVAVTPGHTTYAVGLYQPATKFVKVTQSGFNLTSVAVLHGVTPVVWTNPSGSTVAFTGGPFSQLTLTPGESNTYIFPSIGSYEFSSVSTNSTLTVQVN